MLDVYTDVTRQLAAFGGSVDLIEMCEVRDIRDRVTDAQTRAKRAEFDRAFDVSPECDPTELDRAARTSVALDTMASRRGLGSLAYYYEGVSGNEYEDIATSVIAGNSLLTASGVPVAGPSHHCAIGVGHISGKIEKLSALLRIPCTRVC
jgi:L-arabinose isomerase